MGEVKAMLMWLHMKMKVPLKKLYERLPFIVSKKLNFAILFLGANFL